MFSFSYFPILPKNRLLEKAAEIGVCPEFIEGLALADDFRTLRWEEVFNYPEVALGQIKELVGRC